MYSDDIYFLLYIVFIVMTIGILFAIVVMQIYYSSMKVEKVMIIIWYISFQSVCEDLNFV